MKIFQANIKYQTSYDILDVNSLRVDCVVPFNIFIKKENNYVVILEAGTLLTEKIQKMLLEKENIYVSKKEADKQILSCDTLQSYLEYNQNNLLKTLEFLTEVNSSLFTDYLENTEDKIDTECVRNIVKSITFLIKHNPDYLKKTIAHFQSDSDLANQALYVAIYAVNLGFFLKFTDDQLLRLGIAALLRDLGFKKIDEDIKNKTSKLSEEETKLVQKHPEISVKIAQQNKIADPYILNAIMHHHECNDTSGYPGHLPSENISHGAAILSICDVFNALTNDRPYRKKYSSFEALELMIKDESMGPKFNQKYIKTFLKSLL
jgi:HD-GYP domain-containing protein (c-di-GMP phosphodiesterase class II)